MLDLSSAFVSVDHDIFISRLGSYVVRGGGGGGLNWFKSLENCTSSFMQANLWCTSGFLLLLSFLSIYFPWGPSLGNSFSFHCYADDM